MSGQEKGFAQNCRAAMLIIDTGFESESLALRLNYITALAALPVRIENSMVFRGQKMQKGPSKEDGRHGQWRAVLKE